MMRTADPDLELSYNPSHYTGGLKRFATTIKKCYYSVTRKTELVTTLKRQATKLLKELREEKEPTIVGQWGLQTLEQV